MQQSALSIVMACTVGVFLCGCANVSVARVTTLNQPGIRYWRPAPYLALEETTEGSKITCNAKIVMLPDKSAEYAITMNAGVGTASAKPQLQDGWNLTSMDASADSKTNENITALASLAKVFVPALTTNDHGKAGEPQAHIVRSSCHGLYRMIFDPNSGQISGIQKIGLPGEVNVGSSSSASPGEKGDKKK